MNLHVRRPPARGGQELQMGESGGILDVRERSDKLLAQAL